MAAALKTHGYDTADPVSPAPAADPAAAPPAASPDAPVPSGESQTAPASEPGTPQETPGKKKKWFHKRIDDLTGDKRALERQIAELQQQLASKPAATADPATPAAEPVVEQSPNQKPARPKRPNIRDFETTEEFEVAEEKYETETLPAYEEALSNWTKQETIEALQRERVQQEAQERLAEVHEQGEAEYGDEYQTVVLTNDSVPVSAALMDAIFESENPHRILYWLGKHPEEAGQYAKSTFYKEGDFGAALNCNRKAARLVAGIEASIARPGAPVAPPPAPPAVPPVPPKRVSQAPPPATPLRGGASAPQAPDPRQRVIGQGGWTAEMERKSIASRRR